VNSNWGKIQAYEPSNSVKCPYDRISGSLPSGVDENSPWGKFLAQQGGVPLFRISALTVMAANKLVYVTSDGQLMKMNLLDKPDDAGLISYLHEPVHAR
jgi:hypothetical protein